MSKTRGMAYDIGKSDRGYRSDWFFARHNMWRLVNFWVIPSRERCSCISLHPSIAKIVQHWQINCWKRLYTNMSSDNSSVNTFFMDYRNANLRASALTPASPKSFKAARSILDYFPAKRFWRGESTFCNGDQTYDRAWIRFL